MDKYVWDIVVERLSRKDALDLFRADDGDAVAALEKIEGLRARQANAADAFAVGEIDRDQLARITQSLGKQIADAQAELRRATPTVDLSVLEGMIGPEASARWDAMDVVRRRRVVEALGLRLKIHRVARRGAGFDDATVEPKWPERSTAR